ncbi:hypothetical protein SAMN04489732_103317 [Amycolatopsis saalfeldensis]|uniref:Uncharacterized protein n=1 Tax=Amycolatopsis saalfeldensis TaxID=394193 RepID=A0A1H8UKF2_9PSEU|nr:hypothetical protein SAMN04489732_103317 [Amycolatopsis saalfeldensis]
MVSLSRDAGPNNEASSRPWAATSGKPGGIGYPWVPGASRSANWQACTGRPRTASARASAATYSRSSSRSVPNSTGTCGVRPSRIASTGDAGSTGMPYGAAVNTSVYPPSSQAFTGTRRRQASTAESVPWQQNLAAASALGCSAAARGDVSTAQVASAPEDSPNSVTLRGSPPRCPGPSAAQLVLSAEAGLGAQLRRGEIAERAEPVVDVQVQAVLVGARHPTGLPGGLRTPRPGLPGVANPRPRPARGGAHRRPPTGDWAWAPPGTGARCRRPCHGLTRRQCGRPGRRVLIRRLARSARHPHRPALRPSHLRSPPGPPPCRVAPATVFA